MTVHQKQPTLGEKQPHAQFDQTAEEELLEGASLAAPPFQLNAAPAPPPEQPGQGGGLFGLRTEAPVPFQLNAEESPEASQPEPFQLPTQNETGLPDNLKSGVEQLSGQSLDDVRVQFNSEKPGALQANAYAQGNEIHVGPGQEKHLPEEAWHVTQQKAGKVQANTSVKGQPVNDDPGLEAEARNMGAKALQMNAEPSSQALEPAGSMGGGWVVQRSEGDGLDWTLLLYYFSLTFVGFLGLAGAQRLYAWLLANPQARAAAQDFSGVEGATDTDSDATESLVGEDVGQLDDLSEDTESMIDQLGEEVDIQPFLDEEKEEKGGWELMLENEDYSLELEDDDPKTREKVSSEDDGYEGDTEANGSDEANDKKGKRAPIVSEDEYVGKKKREADSSKQSSKVEKGTVAPITNEESSSESENLSGSETEVQSGSETESLSGSETEAQSGSETESLIGSGSETESGSGTENLSESWSEDEYFSARDYFSDDYKEKGERDKPKPLPKPKKKVLPVKPKPKPKPLPRVPKKNIPSPKPKPPLPKPKPLGPKPDPLSPKAKQPTPPKADKKQKKKKAAPKKKKPVPVSQAPAPQVELTDAGQQYMDGVLRNENWGGQLEAQAMATQYGLETSIFAQKKNKAVPMCKLGKGKNIGLSLLWTGEHYKVIQIDPNSGEVAWNPKKVIFNPDGDGNCLYSAFAYLNDAAVQAGSWPNQDQGLADLSKRYENLSSEAKKAKSHQSRKKAHAGIQPGMANIAGEEAERTQKAESSNAGSESLLLQCAILGMVIQDSIPSSHWKLVLKDKKYLFVERSNKSKKKDDGKSKKEESAVEKIGKEILGTHLERYVSSIGVESYLGSDRKIKKELIQAVLTALYKNPAYSDKEPKKAEKEADTGPDPTEFFHNREIFGSYKGIDLTFVLEKDFLNDLLAEGVPYREIAEIRWSMRSKAGEWNVIKPRKGGNFSFELKIWGKKGKNIDFGVERWKTNPAKLNTSTNHPKKQVFRIRSSTNFNEK